MIWEETGVPSIKSDVNVDGQECVPLLPENVQSVTFGILQERINDVKKAKRKYVRICESYLEPDSGKVQPRLFLLLYEKMGQTATSAY